MNQQCRRLLRIALPLIALCLCPFPSKATTVIMLSDDELILNSRFIVTGHVRSVISAWDDERTAIWTYIEVRTDRFLKGDLSGRTIVLKQLGGVVGGQGMRVYGEPQFQRDQQVLLYLNTATDGTLRVAHTLMGMFSIIEESGTGRKLVRREIDANEVEILSRPDNETITNQAPLDTYIRKIEERLNRISAQRAEAGSDNTESPVFAIPPEYPRKKKESSGFSAEFALIGNGVRWMQADSGQAVSFMLNSNSSPIAGGGSAEIGRAMTAWSAQSGANIRVQIGGQTGGCGIVSDNTNTISFGDCLNQLDVPSGCSGVLALTSTQYSSASKQVSGRIFYTLVESDIVFNKGMDCFLSNSANLAEVACHELGHGIGLAHSGDTSAIMWATAHGHARDAILGEDDKAGVLTIYPASPGGGGGGGGGGGTGGGGTGGGGGGTGGGSTLSITSVALGNGFVGRSYKQTLSAVGGSVPYRWSLIGGAMPPGLTMAWTGVIEGTPTKAGSYSISVQVVDSSPSLHLDSKRVSIEIFEQNGSAPSLPVISKVKVKGSKKLWVYGTNFRQDSIIILNAIALDPKSFEKNGDTTQLYYKGNKRNIGPAGTNQIFVQNSDGRSTVFVF